MGVTVTLAIVVWAASAYLEYKIISRVPALGKLFHNPLFAIAISLVIGYTVGLALGVTNGAAISIAQLAGLATNNITYPFFTRCAIYNERRKQIQNRYQNFKTEHQVVYHEAKTTVVSGLKIVGFIFFTILWLFGLPNRLYRMTKQRRLNPS